MKNGKKTAILACEVEQKQMKNKKEKLSKKDIMFQIYRPNTGLQFRHESLAEIEKKYKKVTNEEAEIHWTQQYDASVNTCSHAYWNGNCRNVNLGHDCEVCKRVLDFIYFLFAITDKNVFFSTILMFKISLKTSSCL